MTNVQKSNLSFITFSNKGQKRSQFIQKINLKNSTKIAKRLVEEAENKPEEQFKVGTNLIEGKK